MRTQVEAQDLIRSPGIEPIRNPRSGQRTEAVDRIVFALCHVLFHGAELLLSAIRVPAVA
jgi:hypothetical protein